MKSLFSWGRGEGGYIRGTDYTESGESSGTPTLVSSSVNTVSVCVAGIVSTGDEDEAKGFVEKADGEV